jgi:FAD/FMN-containing dehydrogenase
VLISRILEFIRRANTAMEALIPSVRPVVFGHCGDGNLHYNYHQPQNVTAESFVAWWSELKKLMHDIVDDMNGSFSVEHGAGQLKKKIGSGTKAPWNWT